MLNKIKSYFNNNASASDSYADLTEKENINISAPNKDMAELLKGRLGGINFSDKKELLEAKLTEKEKEELYAQAHLLFHNKAFQKICEFLINKQGNFTVREAANDYQIFFGRATINGIELLKEEVERLNGLYLESTQKEEKFDKNDLI